MHKGDFSVILSEKGEKLCETRKSFVRKSESIPENEGLHPGRAGDSGELYSVGRSSVSEEAQCLVMLTNLPTLI